MTPRLFHFLILGVTATVVAAAVAVTVLGTQPIPTTLPIPAGTVFVLRDPTTMFGNATAFAIATANFTVGPGNGTLVGSWKSNHGTETALVTPFMPSEPACLSSGRPPPTATNGTFNDSITPGSGVLRFGGPAGDAITVTQTIQVAYGP